MWAAARNMITKYVYDVRYSMYNYGTVTLKRNFVFLPLKYTHTKYELYISKNGLYADDPNPHLHGKRAHIGRRN